MLIDLHSISRQPCYQAAPKSINSRATQSSGLHTIAFPPVEATRLLAACRSHQQTITSLFNAVVALAFLSSQATYALQELKTCNSFYLPFASIDQRSRVPRQIGGPSDYLPFAVSSFAVELDISVLRQA